ncbi:unnamed protein product [Lota lota]
MWLKATIPLDNDHLQRQNCPGGFRSLRSQHAASSVFRLTSSGSHPLDPGPGPGPWTRAPSKHTPADRVGADTPWKTEPHGRGGAKKDRSTPGKPPLRRTKCIGDMVPSVCRHAAWRRVVLQSNVSRDARSVGEDSVSQPVVGLQAYRQDVNPPRLGLKDLVPPGYKSTFTSSTDFTAQTPTTPQRALGSHDPLPGSARERSRTATIQSGGSVKQPPVRAEEDTEADCGAVTLPVEEEAMMSREMLDLRKAWLMDRAVTSAVGIQPETLCALRSPCRPESCYLIPNLQPFVEVPRR